jgi:hypothetical protein
VAVLEGREPLGGPAAPELLALREILGRMGSRAALARGVLLARPVHRERTVLTVPMAIQELPARPELRAIRAAPGVRAQQVQPEALDQQVRQEPMAIPAAPALQGRPDQRVLLGRTAPSGRRGRPGQTAAMGQTASLDPWGRPGRRALLAIPGSLEARGELERPVELAVQARRGTRAMTEPRGTLARQEAPGAREPLARRATLDLPARMARTVRTAWTGCLAPQEGPVQLEEQAIPEVQAGPVERVPLVGLALLGRPATPEAGIQALPEPQAQRDPQAPLARPAS